MTRVFRKGDIVSVTGKVRHDQGDDDYIFIDIDGHHSALMLKPEKVTLVAPRIDPGERVRWTNGVVGTVKAADGDSLWVLKDDGMYVTWPVKEIELAPDGVQVIVDVDDPSAFDHLLSKGIWSPGGITQPAPLDGKVGGEEEQEQQQREIEAEETRRLENEEMDKHFEKHPHG